MRPRSGLYLLVGLCVAALGWLGTAGLVACPFCSAPQLSLVQQLNEAEGAVIVKWSKTNAGQGNELGSTEYTITEVLRLPSTTKYGLGKKVTLLRARAGKEGEQFLLFASKSSEKGTPAKPAEPIEWGSPIPMSEAAINYLKQAPKADAPIRERLRYYLNFLEHPERGISDDAYSEFAGCEYADLKPLASEFPREKLRSWIDDPNTTPSRLGLYGMMLGLCGTEDDAAYMRDKIVHVKDDFRLGIDGVMGGYLLLTGEQGLEVLEETKFRHPKASFSEVYSALMAVRFIWQYGDGVIPIDRLRETMRLLLKRKELADLVIADMSRMKDWGAQDLLMKLYDDPDYDVPSIKRAIIRFMLTCAKAEPNDEQRKYVESAQRHVAELEARDPNTFADAKRLFIPR